MEYKTTSDQFSANAKRAVDPVKAGSLSDAERLISATGAGKFLREKFGEPLPNAINIIERPDTPEAARDRGEMNRLVDKVTGAPGQSR